MESKTRALRVLHIIDTLGGGGSEKLIFDIVRLSDQSRLNQRVVTIFRDGFLGPFVYAEPLSRLGAYGGSQQAGDVAQPLPTTPGTSGYRDSREGSRVVHVMRRLPSPLKRILVGTWNFAFWKWQQCRRAAAHLRSFLIIPAEYLRFRPDIIHTHGFYGFKFGLLFKLLFRRPMVHLVPALFSQMEAQGTGWLVNRYRRFHHLVDCFALDQGFRSELLGAGVPPEKLLDVEGTLDLPAIAAVRRERERHRVEVRSKLRIPGDAPIALSVGRLDPSKGHIHTVEALPLILKQVPDLHWILLGEGEGRSGLEKRIKELGLERHAHLVGFDPEPLPYYAAADVYLRTTTIEGENISSCQAIALGLPTVGFDTHCETDRIAKLGHGILVASADAAALASATCHILSLPERGSALGARGIEYSNAHMGIQKHVDDLLAVYTRLHAKQGFLVTSHELTDRTALH